MWISSLAATILYQVRFLGKPFSLSHSIRIDRCRFNDEWTFKLLALQIFECVASKSIFLRCHSEFRRFSQSKDFLLFTDSTWLVTSLQLRRVLSIDSNAIKTRYSSTWVITFHECLAKDARGEEKKKKRTTNVMCHWYTICCFTLSFLFFSSPFWQGRAEWMNNFMFDFQSLNPEQSSSSAHQSLERNQLFMRDSNSTISTTVFFVLDFFPMATTTNRTFDKSPSALFRDNVRQIKEQTQKLQTNAKEAVRRMPVVLNEPQLKRLKEHQYASEGTTLFDPWMQEFWKWLVEYCPLWVAPNLLTIVGLALNIGTSVLLMIETDGAKEQVRSIFQVKQENSMKFF